MWDWCWVCEWHAGAFWLEHDARPWLDVSTNQKQWDDLLETGLWLRTSLQNLPYWVLKLHLQKLSLSSSPNGLQTSGTWQSKTWNKEWESRQHNCLQRQCSLWRSCHHRLGWSLHSIHEEECEHELRIALQWKGQCTHSPLWKEWCNLEVSISTEVGHPQKSMRTPFSI